MPNRTLQCDPTLAAGQTIPRIDASRPQSPLLRNLVSIFLLLQAGFVQWQLAPSPSTAMSNIDLMREQYRTDKRISQGYKVPGAVRKDLLEGRASLAI